MRREPVSSVGGSGETAPPTPVTFVFADLVGYTALIDHHGDDLAADVAVGLEALVLTEIDSSAEFVKTMGDAVMLRVDRPADAVLLALRLCDRVCNRDQWPQLAVGMAHGPAATRGPEYFGATVNRASRICAFARAGEVLVDHAAFMGARSLDAVGWIDIGEVPLRNIASPVQLYRAHPYRSVSHIGLVDPVCRMTVDSAHAVVLEHAGVRLAFCSGECAGKFIVDPGRYGQPTTSDDA